MGIKEKNEFWEGFGAEELKKASFFLFIVLILNIIINLIVGNIFFFIAVTIIAIFSSGMVFTKSDANLSVANQISNMVVFLKSQKIYYYKSLDEWK